MFSLLKQRQFNVTVTTATHFMLKVATGSVVVIAIA